MSKCNRPIKLSPRGKYETMNATGVQYTWKNNREREELVCERLDRAFVNLDWLHTHEHSSLEAWPISISNHAPLILDTHKRQTFHKRPQRFEAMWLLHLSCKKLIEETWQERISCSAAYILTTKLKRVQQVCNEWNKNDLGNIHKHLADLKNQLTYLQNQHYTPESQTRERETAGTTTIVGYGRILLGTKS